MRFLVKGSASETLSFVRDNSWTVNDFTLTFTKTVADDVSFSLTSLADENALESCTPFITLPVDLSTQADADGEYVVVLSNEGTDYESLLVEITDGLPDSGDGAGDVYGGKILL